MAGPYRLAPQEVQGGIPTWPSPRRTKVKVEALVKGNFEMTAGGAPTETNVIEEGPNNFERDFGGVYLSVKNLTDRDVTVTTE